MLNKIVIDPRKKCKSALMQLEEARKEMGLKEYLQVVYDFCSEINDQLIQFHVIESNKREYGKVAAVENSNDLLALVMIWNWIQHINQDCGMMKKI